MQKVLWTLKCCVNEDALVPEKKVSEFGFKGEIEIGLWRTRMEVPVKKV